MHRWADKVGPGPMYKVPWRTRFAHKARHRKQGMIKSGIEWLQFAFTPVLA